MPCRAGITTRPEERKKEWQLLHRSMRNWQVTPPFSSRAEAQAWEDGQRCEKSAVSFDSCAADCVCQPVGSRCEALSVPLLHRVVHTAYPGLVIGHGMEPTR